MKTWFKPILLASLFAVSGSVALAQAGFGNGQVGKQRAQQARIDPDFMKERMELRFARLEVALGLQTNQQAAWEQFKKAALLRSEKNWQRFQTMQENRIAAKTAPERLALMEESQKARQADFAEMRKSVETFYRTLSGAQQKIFDAEFGPGPFARAGRGVGMGWQGNDVGGPARGYNMRHSRGMGPGGAHCYMGY